VTSLFPWASMRPKHEPICAELLRVSAVSLPVTSRSSCRTIRACSPSISHASRPRPARDIRTLAPAPAPTPESRSAWTREHARPAAALAHRRVHPERPTIDDDARACACACADTTRCTFAGVSALIAPLETIVGIPYNIDADLMAPSMMAYRDPRRSGAWWVISDEHTRVISGEQRRTTSPAEKSRTQP